MKKIACIYRPLQYYIASLGIIDMIWNIYNISFLNRYYISLRKNSSNMNTILFHTAYLHCPNIVGKIILISIGLAIVCKKGPFWPRLGGTFGGMAPQRSTQTPAICGALKQWDLIRLSRISIEYYPTHGVQLELYFCDARPPTGEVNIIKTRRFWWTNFFLFFIEELW